MTTLTKQGMVEQLVETQGMPIKTAKALVEAFFETISSALESKEEVLISGFGRFNLREKEARPGRNPKTLEPAEISARTVTTFAPSPILKNAVND